MTGIGKDADFESQELTRIYIDLDEKTMELSRNLFTLMGKQGRLERELKEITNSIKLARSKTRSITMILNRISKGNVRLTGIRSHVEDEEVASNQEISNDNRGHSLSDDMCKRHEQSDKVVSAANLHGRNSTDRNSPFPKELILITDSGDMKMYSLSELDVTEMIPSKGAFSCNILQINFDCNKLPEVDQSRNIILEGFVEGDQSNSNSHELDSENESMPLVEKLERLIYAEDMAYEQLKRQLKEDADCEVLEKHGNY